MVASLLPNGEQVFLDDDGIPLAGGSVYFYTPGTDALKNTWQNAAMSILNTNPVVLDAAGRAIIWGYGTYRQVVKDADGNTVWDQETSDWGSPLASLQTEVDDLEAQVVALSEIINNYTSYINTQVFNTAGDHTYTPTEGTTAIAIELLGGGAGGEGVAQPGANKVSVGSGGGGGEWIKTDLITSGVVASTIHVGAAGTGGSSGHNPGTAGADSTAFGYTAKGGTGGTSSNSAVTPPVSATSVAGGTGGSGPDIVQQQPGGPSGTEMTPSTAAALGGSGGSSKYGTGGVSPACGTNASHAGNPGTGYGSGGSGAVASGTGAAAAGGDGTVGQIIIYEYGAATGTIPQGAGAATQTDEELGTATTVYTNPAVQQFHDSAAKAHGAVAADGTFITGYNADSTKLDTGEYQVSFLDIMNEDGYTVVLGAQAGDTDASPFAHAAYYDRLAAGFKVVTATGLTSPEVADCAFCFAVFGRASGAPAPYEADAVVFDGSTYLYRNSQMLGVSDTPSGLISVWVNTAGAGNTAPSLFGNYSGVPIMNPLELNTPLASRRMRFVNLAGGATTLQVKPPVNSVPLNTWVNIIVSWNTNFSAGNKLVKIAINDVVQTLTIDADLGPAYSWPFTSKISWAVGALGDSATSAEHVSSATKYTGYMADMQAWFGLYLDLDIEGNRRLFIDADGKPVDPTDASNALGSPTLLFSGDAASFGTNQGVGGAFTTTGAFTNAPSSPSD